MGLIDPKHPCRVMPTRGCPPNYGEVCGGRPCARFESDDEAPWLDTAEITVSDEGEIGK